MRACLLYEWITAAALALLLVAPAGALAATRRIAVVVGNNAGGGERPPLRFAEADADKVAQVLAQLGGVASDDVLILRGEGRAGLDEALRTTAARVRTWHGQPDTRVILVFYFSGHSDGEAIELGRDRFPFGDLRRALKATGADVRLVVVDSCRSGALLATKGARPGPGFEIRLRDDLVTSGHAFLSSSAVDEAALESVDLRGSFFTHHLVSGLRGAADATGDGRITLAEAYRYAFDRTVSATSDTLTGPQHPSYDFQLAGQGELVLADLAQRSSLLELPEADRLVVELDGRDLMVAETVGGAARRLAVEPGAYTLRAFRGAELRVGRVTVGAGATARVRWDELRPAPLADATRKGPEEEGATRVGMSLVGTRAVATDAGPLAGLRIDLRPSGSPFVFALAAGTSRGSSFRETALVAAAGWRMRWSAGRLETSVGLEARAGAVVQLIDDGARAWSATLGLGPAAGVSWAATRGLALELDARLPATGLRRDGVVGWTLQPDLGLGLVWTP